MNRRQKVLSISLRFWLFNRAKRRVFGKHTRQKDRPSECSFRIFEFSNMQIRWIENKIVFHEFHVNGYFAYYHFGNNRIFPGSRGTVHNVAFRANVFIYILHRGESFIYVSPRTKRNMDRTNVHRAQKGIKFMTCARAYGNRLRSVQVAITLMIFYTSFYFSVNWLNFHGW